MQDQLPNNQPNIPPEAMRWSWAAFFGGSLWGIRHRVWETLLVVVNFAFAVSSFLYVLSVFSIPTYMSPDRPLMRSFLSAEVGYVFIVVPIIFVAVHLYLGLFGNRLAWRKNIWPSVEKFQETQRHWTMIGIGATVALIPMVLFLYLWFIGRLM